jgi:hypothetical protein
MTFMRVPTLRLLSLAAGVAAILSCEAGPAGPAFGGGIGGGGPPPPGSQDTVTPFIIIDTPLVNQLANVGDSILVVTRIHDDREIESVEILGVKITGDPDLGTLRRVTRFPKITAPIEGQNFPANLTDTTIRRYLQPAFPLDTTSDTATVIMVILTDASGNVDTVTRNLTLVTGPKVSISTPVSLDSVPQGVAMSISVRATQVDGIDSVKIIVRGDTGFTGAARLDTVLAHKYVGVQRDVVLDTTVMVPATAPLRGRITIEASATDRNRNPGSAAPVVVIVRAPGTTTPRVTQIVQARLETTDSVTVKATGDGIQWLGYVVTDLTGTVIERDSTQMPSPFTSNARRSIQLFRNLTTANRAAQQGKTVKVSTFAIDQSGTYGYSIQDVAGTSAQSDPTLAFTEESLVVFGRTFVLPRPGVVGDIAVDEARGHVFVSNLSFNRLEVFRANTNTFLSAGIAVGSQPWGLFRTATSDDSLFVANSGGTNISKVFIGTSNASNMSEDLDNRIRTRAAPMFLVEEIINASTGRISISVDDALLFSDRPQYVGQVTDGAGYNPVFFSTRPTEEAPKGIIHWFDPGQASPELRSIISYSSSDANNYLLRDVDSVFVHPASGQSSDPDTVFICDHVPGTLNASQCVQRPEPAGGSTSIGVGAAVAAIQALVGSDVISNPHVNPATIGLTDTTFVAVSGDKNFIAFGAGNTSGAGNVFMSAANPVFFSPLFSQEDLTNNAAEKVFGLALDSTGITVAAHGAESYFASVDDPFHLRLQGKYSTFATGAGIAFHPGERGTSTPVNQRLAFVASDNLTVEVLDVAHYLSAGSLPIKGKLYGPIRVTRRFPTDPSDIVLKLYGVTSEGLVIVNVRQTNVTPVPIRAP